LSAEREGIMFDVKVNLDSDLELTGDRGRDPRVRVWDEISLRTASSKLAHLRRQLGRITTEQGVQTEEKEKLCAELDRRIEALNSRARFLLVVSNDSTRASTSGFPGVTSTLSVDQNFGSTPSGTQTNWSHVMGSWGVTFAGDRNKELAVFDFLTQIKEKCAIHDISQDDLLRHVKLLLKGEALVWYRMVESRVSSWTELCERLKEEFLPFRPGRRKANGGSSTPTTDLLQGCDSRINASDLPELVFSNYIFVSVHQNLRTERCEWSTITRK
jgi:hypothetical protein